MARHDSKRSEKEYLRRTAAGEWERHKPFSPPGSNTLDESAALMRDFAVAITHLPPRPSDRILDLGAGACWCSDWLQRLNCHPVAVDISHDMLRLGRTRLPRPEAAHLVTGDLEALPFADGAFDKAYCLSAIHHVPDIPRALAEIARVLTDDGAAFFSEPGVGHAEKPTSVSAMHDFGVLEQEIVPADFMKACADGGFADVRLKPLSYVNPALSLSADQWIAWQRRAWSKRPVRALRTIWRGVLNLVGLGKKTVLFDEALAMTVLRLLAGAMHHHPVVVARKSIDSAGEADRHMAQVRLVHAPMEADRGTTLPMIARIVNAGETEWPVDPARGTGVVRLGVQLLDGERRLINRDFHREAIPSRVAPGRAAEVSFACPVPGEPGTYHLKLDMVVEGVAWLEPRGAETAIHALRVR
jgi:SAM-dependent methyltransferase